MTRRCVQWRVGSANSKKRIDLRRARIGRGAELDAVEVSQHAAPVHLSKEHGIMQAVPATRGDVRMFLPHIVVGGLEDDRYVVKRRAQNAEREIVSIQADGAKPMDLGKGRGAASVAKALEGMRLACDEVIIAMGIKSHDGGAQLWVGRSLSIFTDLRQRD